MPDSKYVKVEKQVGVKFPNGSIIWAKVGDDQIVWNNNYYYLLPYKGNGRKWDELVKNYQHELTRMGGTTGTLERVERQIITITTPTEKMNTVLLANIEAIDEELKQPFA